MRDEELASRLRSAHPDAEPFEVAWPTLAAILVEAGIDPEDDALVAATLVAWERLLAA